MSDSLFQPLFNALSYTNIGTLSEFHRVLDRREPVAASAEPMPAANVVPFHRRTYVPAFHNPMLPKARLKP